MSPPCITDPDLMKLYTEQFRNGNKSGAAYTFAEMGYGILSCANDEDNPEDREADLDSGYGFLIESAQQYADIGLKQRARVLAKKALAGEMEVFNDPNTGEITKGYVDGRIHEAKALISKLSS